MYSCFLAGLWEAALFQHILHRLNICLRRYYNLVQLFQDPVGFSREIFGWGVEEGRKVQFSDTQGSFEKSVMSLYPHHIESVIVDILS